MRSNIDRHHAYCSYSAFASWEWCYGEVLNARVSSTIYSLRREKLMPLSKFGLRDDLGTTRISGAVIRWVSSFGRRSLQPCF